jgi:hypothetical protein
MRQFLQPVQAQNRDPNNGAANYPQQQRPMVIPGSRLADKDGDVPLVPMDRELFHEWIYPTNRQVRKYQVSIACNALLHNTLVVLPTGLGKTLVAAVVMYNYYRWFPTGKVVFMAPTKPLVNQQIEACHGVMGIPVEHTAELQGSVKPEERERLWSEKRVFYCTPQSMANDLQKGACDPAKIVCIVVDGQFAVLLLLFFWPAKKKKHLSSQFIFLAFALNTSLFWTLCLLFGVSRSFCFDPSLLSTFSRVNLSLF